MKYIKFIALILLNGFFYNSYGKNVSDTSLRFWMKFGGNSSLHHFNSTPIAYKSENLFSRGFEISQGLTNSVADISIGYRNHLVSFKQFNSSLDSINNYGNHAVYNYIFESIPIRCQINSQFKSISVGYNFGFSFNRGNFKKVTVTTLPDNEHVFYPKRKQNFFEYLSLSTGVAVEKHVNSKFTLGLSLELLYDITRTYVYEVPSQMNPPKDYLNPFSYSRKSLFGSFYAVYGFN